MRANESIRIKYLISYLHLNNPMIKSDYYSLSFYLFYCTTFFFKCKYLFYIFSFSYTIFCRCIYFFLRICNFSSLNILFLVKCNYSDSGKLILYYSQKGILCILKINLNILFGFFHFLSFLSMWIMSFSLFSAGCPTVCNNESKSTFVSPCITA